jgi:hypothetical protein
MSASNALAVGGTTAVQPSEAPGRLVVAWQHPTERSIDPVGFLTRTDNAFAFSYIRNALTVHDFPGLLGFDDPYRTYQSSELFPLFAQRAMDPRRPDYHRYVNDRLGLEGDPGPWEQIARSQGYREGDTIQLFPEPSTDGDDVRCLFLVHGMRHADKSTKTINGVDVSATREQIDAALQGLEPGDKLGIFREPGNVKNPLAIIVTISPDQLIPIGWVPDLLVEDLQRLLDCAQVTVTAEHINGADAPWHLRLLARLRATPAPGFRFFVSDRWQPLTAQVQ